MIRIRAGIRGGIAGILFASGVAGCGSERQEPAWTDMYSLEVRSGGEIVATWTLWGGWDAAALPGPVVGSDGGRVTLTVAGYDLDGRAIPISAGSEHSIGYRLADGAPEGVLELAQHVGELFRAGEVHLYAAGPGTTGIEFTLNQGGRVRQWTTPVSVSVSVAE